MGSLTDISPAVVKQLMETVNIFFIKRLHLQQIEVIRTKDKYVFRWYSHDSIMPIKPKLPLHSSGQKGLRAIYAMHSSATETINFPIS